MIMMRPREGSMVYHHGVETSKRLTTQLACKASKLFTSKQVSFSAEETQDPTRVQSLPDCTLKPAFFKNSTRNTRAKLTSFSHRSNPAFQQQRVKTQSACKACTSSVRPTDSLTWFARRTTSSLASRRAGATCVPRAVTRWGKSSSSGLQRRTKRSASLSAASSTCLDAGMPSRGKETRLCLKRRCAGQTHRSYTERGYLCRRVAFGSPASREQGQAPASKHATLGEYTGPYKSPFCRGGISFSCCVPVSPDKRP